MDEDENGGVEEASVLVSVVNTSKLLDPIASSKRIKYTSVGVSVDHIALGANTGGVYCFHRNDLSYIRILANQEGGVSLVKFSPGGTHVAVVSGGGHLILWELNLSGQGISKDSIITDLVWDVKGGRVFFGDEQGRVAASGVPKKKFKKPDEIIFTDKTVVQMDMHQDLLLVSTVTRCLIINVTTKEQVQIGRKSRDGLFGACFNLRWEGKPPVVYSARPGSRLWEADVAGTVVSTLKHRELIATPPSPIFGIGMSSVTTPPQTYATPTLPFPQLLMLQQRYMVGWSPSSALCVFVCASYKLAMWTCALHPEDKVHSDGASVWVLSESGREVRVLQMMTVRHTLHLLLQHQLVDQAHVVLSMHLNEVARLLTQDYSLVKDCSAALTLPANMLSQELVKLKELAAKLMEESAQREEKERQLSEDAQLSEDEDLAEVGGHVEDHYVEEGSNVEGNHIGGSDVGGGNERGVLEKCEIDVIELETRERDGRGPEARIMDGRESEATAHGKREDDVHCVSGDLLTEEDDHSLTASDAMTAAAAPDEVGGAQEVGGAVIQDDASFPSGPATVNAGVEEVDYFESMIVNEEDEPVSADTAIHLLSSESTEEPLGGGAQSDAIPIARASVETGSVSDTGGSASASLASSHGETPSKTSSSFKGVFAVGPDNPMSSVESQGGVADREGVAMRSRQMSLQAEEDVIAVPTITRSSSGSSSSSSKSKSKKKSRRKKSQTQQLQGGKEAQDVPKISPSSTSASLLHIPEEEDILPFPDVGLPSTANSSPSVSITPSPYTSLPSTPPLPHSPPPISLIASPSDRDLPPLERRTSTKEVWSREEKAKPRSTSLDLSAIGGAFSKGQKVMRGFFTSLSSQQMSSLPQMESVDVSSAPATSQPVVYRNADADLPTHTSTFSPISSAEEGELAENLSPLAKDRPQFTNGPLSRSLSPIPEVTAFITAIMATREALDSPAMLCSPPLLKAELEAWLARLDAFHTFMTTSDLSVTSALSPSTYLCVCYLTSLCAEMGIYAHTHSRDAPPTSQTTPSQVHDASSTSETTPSRDQDAPPTSLGSFIQHYMDYLDKKRLLWLLSLQDWPTRRQCWLLLATMPAAHEQEPPTSPSSPVNKDWSTALFQYKCSREGNTLQYMAERFPDVPPWQVALSCDLWDQQLVTSCDLRRDYVEYLWELLGNAVSDVALNMLTETFVQDAELLIVSLRTVLEMEDVNHTHNTKENGGPRPWSHMTEWENADGMEWLVDMATQLKEITDKQKAAETCRAGGYWLGYARLLVAMGDKESALKTLLALGDSKLLTESQPWGFLLESVDHWKIVLEYLAPPTSLITQTPPLVESLDDSVAMDSSLNLGSSTEPNSSGYFSLGGKAETPAASLEESHDSTSPVREVVSTSAEHSLKEEDVNGIMLNQLLPTLLKTLDSPTINSLLTAHSCVFQSDKWGGETQKDLHKQILTVASIHAQQRGIAHSLLEKVDRYLWTKRRNTIGPHLRLTLQTEKNAARATRDTQPLSPTFVAPGPVHPRLEDINANWGTRTSNRRDRCAMCNLSLTHLVSDKQPGLMAFLCGHAVHRSCAPEGVCVTCFNKHFPSSSFSSSHPPTTYQQLSDLLL